MTTISGLQLPNETSQSLTGFEGPEKLMEIWFNFDDDVRAEGGLRMIEEPIWVDILNTVKCQILSVKHSKTCDLYLLSESSLFIFVDKMILKTCGTTTLLNCLDILFNSIEEYVLKATDEIIEQRKRSDRIADQVKESNSIRSSIHSLPNKRPMRIDYLFYSRKQFLFPERQIYPHNGWSNEVQHLEKFIDLRFNDIILKTKSESSPINVNSSSYNEKLNTRAYVVGDMGAGGDHWCFFVAHKSDEGVGKIDLPLDRRETEDQTLEVMMTNLKEENMKVFWKKESEVSKVDMKSLAITDGDCRVDPNADMDIQSYTESNSMLDYPDYAELEIDQQSNGSNDFDCDNVSLHSIQNTSVDSPDRVYRESGIENIFKGVFCNDKGEVDDSICKIEVIDHYIFDPCGYSLNGILTISETNHYYFTIHVTPESHCSYASFETNIVFKSKSEVEALIANVCDVFRPGRFSTTIFCSDFASDIYSSPQDSAISLNLPSNDISNITGEVLSLLENENISPALKQMIYNKLQFMNEIASKPQNKPRKISVIENEWQIPILNDATTEVKHYRRKDWIRHNFIGSKWDLIFSHFST